MTLLEEAKRRILAAIDDEKRKGIYVVSPSRNVDRLDLIVQVVDECAGAPEYGEDDFRTLCVSRDPTRLERIRTGIRRRRKKSSAPRRPLQDYVYSGPQSTVAQPRELSFVTKHLLQELAPRFPPQSVELLVLDELQPHEMARLVSSVERVGPLFTLLMATCEPPADSPWLPILGEPVVLRGPAYTPPYRQRADDTAGDTT